MIDGFALRSWCLRVPPAEDPAFRIAYAAELVAMVESARLLERGRTSDAEARIAQVEDPQGLAPDDLDRWKGRTERTAGRAAATDGRLDAELRSRNSNDDKLALLRSLRTRAIADLGPIVSALNNVVIFSPLINC